jgi:integrase
MPKQVLTDALVKSVSSPPAGILELWDERCPGLCLRVMPTGRKVWSLRYRPLGSAKNKRLSLGTYPTLSLSKARVEAEANRALARKGSDPARERADRKARAQSEEASPALTFDRLSDLYLSNYAKKRKTSWANDDGYLKRDVRPAWGSKLAETVTKADVAALLLRISERAPVTANRVRSVLVTLFQWAVDEGLLTASPMIGVRKPHRERRQAVDRVMTDAELAVLWRAIEAARLEPALRVALKVLALTGQRPNEVAGLAVRELMDLGDPTQARVEIPAQRMKARRRHVVPLTPSVVALIQDRLRSNPDSEHVFASRYGQVARVARHSLSQAMRRIISGLDESGPDAAVVRGLKADPPTPHAFRRTVATGLARLGVAREDRKAVLAHVEGDVLGGHYDAYDRMAEKRRALEAWDQHVSRLLA